jgi:hypothetical protein
MARRRRQAVAHVSGVWLHVSLSKPKSSRITNANRISQDASRPSDRARLAFVVQARFGVGTSACRNHERHICRSADLRFADGAPGGGFPERQELEDTAWLSTGGGLFVGRAGSRCDEFGRSLGVNQILMYCCTSTLFVNPCISRCRISIIDTCLRRKPSREGLLITSPELFQSCFVPRAPFANFTCR